MKHQVLRGKGLSYLCVLLMAVALAVFEADLWLMDLTTGEGTPINYKSQR